MRKMRDAVRGGRCVMRKMRGAGTMMIIVPKMTYDLTNKRNCHKTITFST
jgi:hypothetical protein